MAGDVLFFKAENGGHGLLYGLRILHGRPGFHPAVPEFGHGGRRLHGRVGQHWGVVVRFQFPGDAGERRIEVAAVADDFAGLVHAAEEFLLVGGRVVAGVRGIGVPFYLQFLAPLHRGPSGIGQHRDAAGLLEHVRLLETGDRNGLTHTFHLEGLGVIEALDLGIVHGRPFDGSAEHAWTLSVLPKNGCPRDDIVLIHHGNLLANVAVLGRLFEAQLFPLGYGEFGGGGNQIADIRAAVGRRVNNHAILHGDFARGHVPLLGGGPFQHQARSGAGLVHGVDEIADRAGSHLYFANHSAYRRWPAPRGRSSNRRPSSSGDDERERGSGCRCPFPRGGR